MQEEGMWWFTLGLENGEMGLEKALNSKVMG